VGQGRTEVCTSVRMGQEVTGCVYVYGSGRNCSMYMCMGLRGTEVCTSVWDRKELRCVHVYGSGRNGGVYKCVCQEVTEVCTYVYIREELRCVHVNGSRRN